MSNELDKHKLLKRNAKVFLKELGCTEIKVERRFVKGNYSIRADVSGYCGNQIFIVECGTTTLSYLNRAIFMVDRVYMWEYGESKPTLYHKNTANCILDRLVNIFPNFDLNWSNEVKERWYTSFFKLNEALSSIIPVIPRFAKRH